MIAFVNPPYGDDATAVIAANEAAARARPFKTHRIAVEAMQAYRLKHPDEPHTLRETHKPPPPPPIEEDPQIEPPTEIIALPRPELKT